MSERLTLTWTKDELCALLACSLRDTKRANEFIAEIDEWIERRGRKCEERGDA